MTGIYLIFIAMAWVALCFALSMHLTKSVQGIYGRFILAAFLFLILSVAPLADEIVGGFQFRSLCKSGAENFFVAVKNPEGRLTRYSSNPLNRSVPRTAIEILHTTVEYVDVNTGELVVRFNRYSAKGGFLIRLLGISEHNAPLIFNYSSCSPERAKGEVVSRTLKFAVVN